MAAIFLRRELRHLARGPVQSKGQRSCVTKPWKSFDASAAKTDTASKDTKAVPKDASEGKSSASVPPVTKQAPAVPDLKASSPKDAGKQREAEKAPAERMSDLKAALAKLAPKGEASPSMQGKDQAAKASGAADASAVKGGPATPSPDKVAAPKIIQAASPTPTQAGPPKPDAQGVRVTVGDKAAASSKASPQSAPPDAKASAPKQAADGKEAKPVPQGVSPAAAAPPKTTPQGSTPAAAAPKPSPQGSAPSGAAPKVSPQGAAPGVEAPKAAPQGAAPAGAAPKAAPQGAASSGAAPKAAPQGAASSGAAPKVAPQATAPAGAAPKGSPQAAPSTGSAPKAATEGAKPAGQPPSQGVKGSSAGSGSKPSGSAMAPIFANCKSVVFGSFRSIMAGKPLVAAKLSSTGTGQRSYGDFSINLGEYRHSSLRKANDLFTLRRRPRWVVLPDKMPRSEDKVQLWIDRTARQLGDFLREQDKHSLEKVKLLLAPDAETSIGPVRYVAEPSSLGDGYSTRGPMRMFILQAAADQKYISTFVAAYEVDVVRKQPSVFWPSRRYDDIYGLDEDSALSDWMRCQFRQKIESNSNVKVRLKDVEGTNFLSTLIYCGVPFGAIFIIAMLAQKHWNQANVAEETGKEIVEQLKGLNRELSMLRRPIPVDDTRRPSLDELRVSHEEPEKLLLVHEQDNHDVMEVMPKAAEAETVGQQLLEEIRSDSQVADSVPEAADDVGQKADVVVDTIATVEQVQEVPHVVHAAENHIESAPLDKPETDDIDVGELLRSSLADSIFNADPESVKWRSEAALAAVAFLSGACWTCCVLRN